MLTSFGRLSCYFLIPLLFCVGLTACAQRPFLVVDYKTIEASNQLAGKQVRLQVKDLRTDPSIFTPEAAADFPGFQEQYRFVEASEASKAASNDLDLTSLVYQAFALRLEKMGAEVVDLDRDNVPLFQVSIKQLKIDLKDSRWVTSVSFEGNLSVDGRLIAKETVSGEAERIKILGSGGADENFSNIFTEIINRLNIAKLFKHAKV